MPSPPLQRAARGGGEGRGWGEEEFSQGSERPSFVTSLLGDRPREYFPGSDFLVLGTRVAGGGVSILCIRNCGARRMSPDWARERREWVWGRGGRSKRE
jgi:hypothetical protein